MNEDEITENSHLRISALFLEALLGNDDITHHLIYHGLATLNAAHPSASVNLTVTAASR